MLRCFYQGFLCRPSLQELLGSWVHTAVCHLQVVRKALREPTVYQQGNMKLQKVLDRQIYQELLSAPVDQSLLEVLDPQRPHAGPLHRLDLVL